MHWKGLYFFDTVLPFGLRSAPFYFNMVSDGLEWIIRNKLNIRGVLHILDDFFIALPPPRSQCNTALCNLLTLFTDLDIPLAQGKTFPPSTQLKFVGILLDSSTMEVRLPDDKLSRLRSLVSSWLSNNLVPRAFPFFPNSKGKSPGNEVGGLKLVAASRTPSHSSVPCILYAKWLPQGTPLLPASEVTLIYWVAQLAESVKFHTIKVYAQLQQQLLASQFGSSKYWVAGALTPMNGTFTFLRLPSYYGYLSPRQHLYPEPPYI